MEKVRWGRMLEYGSGSHDSQLKENRHVMQAGQAVINKTPWVAVYPAFFADLVSVYRTKVASALSLNTGEGKEKAQMGGEEKQPCI